MAWFWPVACVAEVRDGGAEILCRDLGGVAPGLAHGAWVVAGIAVRPAGGGGFVGLALPFQVRVAPGLSVAFVERAPRLPG